MYNLIKPLENLRKAEYVKSCKDIRKPEYV